MHVKTINTLTALAQKKARAVKSNMFAFIISSALAGAYIGLGIILIFSVGADIAPGYQKLVMGISFGIALTLVVFAGSDLFTGHTLYMSLGLLHGNIQLRDLLAVWSICWVGNLIGAVILALVFVAGGGAATLVDAGSLLQSTALYKTSSSGSELVARGILCNFLVCLALWMSARVDSDIAKCVVIFWCLYAFIASGFEHSVANMTLLGIAWLTQQNEIISIVAVLHNLVWVTVGNIIGGAIFVALAYWKVSELDSDQLYPPT